MVTSARIRNALGLLSGMLLLGGCATVLASGPSTVRVESDPSGAKVTAQNGEVWGTTPLSRTEKPVGDRVLTFTLAGYDAAVLPLTRTIKPIAFLNLTNLLGWAIDFATGAMWKYDESYLRAQLARKTAELTASERRVFACANIESIHNRVAKGATKAEEAEVRLAAVEEVAGVTRATCSDGQR